MIVRATIEIPMGSNYKYEVDKVSGLLVLDRVISLKLPYNYGFINRTLHDDGDPLDLFLATQNPIPPLTQVDVKVLNGFACEDNGIRDDKIIGILDRENLDENILYKIKKYLTNYKPGFKVLKLLTEPEVVDIIEKNKKSYFKHELEKTPTQAFLNKKPV